MGRDLQTQIPTAKIGAAISLKQGWRQEGHPVFVISIQPRPLLQVKQEVLVIIKRDTPALMMMMSC